MNEYKARVVLYNYCKGYEIEREKLVEAIKTETLPRIEKFIDFNEMPFKTTAFIERFEPDKDKRWVELDELIKLFGAKSHERKNIYGSNVR